LLLGTGGSGEHDFNLLARFRWSATFGTFEREVSLPAAGAQTQRLVGHGEVACGVGIIRIGLHDLRNALRPDGDHAFDQVISIGDPKFDLDFDAHDWEPTPCCKLWSTDRPDRIHHSRAVQRT